MIRAPSQSGQPSVIVEMTLELSYRHYAIVGSSAEQLVRCMEMLAPRGPNGPCAAYTKWTVRWAFRCNAQAGGYALAHVRAAARVIVTLPRWEPPRKASSVLVSSWQRFLRDLEDHERGHAMLAAAAGTAVYAALSAHPLGRDPETLRAEANQVAMRVVEDYRVREGDYDAHAQPPGFLAAPR